MIFVKENGEQIVAKCNMCKKEYTIDKISCTKTGSGYSLENNFKCSYCGQTTKSIERYSMYHPPEQRPILPESKNQEIDLITKRNDDTIQCPKCGSTLYTPVTKGFGLGKAAVGGLLFGPVGLLGGVIGSKKVNLVCLKCRHKW